MNRFWTLIDVPAGTNVANVPYYATPQAAGAAALERAEANYTENGFKQVVVVLEAVKVVKPPARPALTVSDPT